MKNIFAFTVIGQTYPAYVSLNEADSHMPRPRGYRLTVRSPESHGKAGASGEIWLTEEQVLALAQQIRERLGYKRISGTMGPEFVFNFDSLVTEQERKRVYDHFISRNVQRDMSIKFDGWLYDEGIILTVFERTDWANYWTVRDV